jgi:hypothetical protein
MMIGRLIASVVPLGAGLWWSGFLSPDSHTYALPLSDAQSRLEHADLPPVVYGENEPDLTVNSTGSQVIWRVKKDGEEVMRAVMDLTPVDPTHTKVHIALDAPTEGKFGNVRQRMESDRTLKNLYLTAMKEQVDAVLANHYFRYSAISGATMAATLAHMGAISASMDRAAEADRKRERANMDQAYRDAGID